MLYLFESTFQIGYNDVLFHGGQWNPDYENWDSIKQRDYERGRQIAAEYGDRFGIRNMKSPYSESIMMSDALANVYLDSTIN